MQCIGPGIQRMPAHHVQHHHPEPIYDIEPSVGTPVTLQLSHCHNPSPVARGPRAESACNAVP